MAENVKKSIRFGVETNADLVLSNSSLPFGNRTGALITLPTIIDVNVFASDRLPGICILDLVPMVGRTNDAINTEMGKLYARLIRKISGAKDIEKTDQFMYLECGKTLVDVVCKLKTAYHLAFMYKEYNLYWPKTIIRAIGFDADDLTANLEDFRAWINRFITRCRSLNFPNIAYLKSGWEYGRTILLDSPDVARAQLYVCNLARGYKWDPTSDPNGTLLVSTSLGDSATVWTFAQIRTNYEQFLDALVYDQDAIDISAWYDHLLEDGDRLTFTDCTPDMDHVQFTYDIEALTVIENAEILPRFSSWTNVMNIYQLNGMILQGAGFTAKATDFYEADMPRMAAPHIVNCHKPKPTPKDIAKYCSLKHDKSYYMTSWPSEMTIYVNNCNDYAVSDCKIFILSNIGGGGTYLSYKSDFDFNGGTKTSLCSYLSELDQFIHAPHLWLGEYKVTGSNYVVVIGTKFVRYYPRIKFDNYVHLSNDLLDNLCTSLWYTNLEDK